MNYVVALDSFKGSLTSLEAGVAVRDAILDIDCDSSVVVLPLAEMHGTYNATVCVANELVRSTNPFGRAKKEVTFVYQKLLLFLSKPQAWHIITRQRVYHQLLWSCISSRQSRV